MKFSHTEEKMIAYLKNHLGEDVAVEDLATIIYEGRNRPFFWRNSVSVLLRNLISKSEGKGDLTIRRTSNIGQGAKATYKAVEKKDADFSAIQRL